MRKIEQNMLAAIRSGKGFSSGNTCVVHEAAQNDGTPVARISLHGNHIANVYVDRIMMTLAGWPTVTTRSRLNAICREFANSTGFSRRLGQQVFFTGEGRAFREIENDEWVMVPRK